MSASASPLPVLVTGGAGYIGSHAVLALRDAGWPVAVIDDLSNGTRSVVPADVPFFLGSVADRALVGRILAEQEIGAILHFAGSIVVPDSVEVPLDYYANNTLASHALISAAVAAGVPHFVFSSTAAVYGSPSHPWNAAARPWTASYPPRVSSVAPPGVTGFSRSSAPE